MSSSLLKKSLKVSRQFLKHDESLCILEISLPRLSADQRVQSIEDVYNTKIAI
ncbi:unnamed protein product, partial [Nesidiocoris tenuis]